MKKTVETGSGIKKENDLNHELELEKFRQEYLSLVKEDKDFKNKLLGESEKKKPERQSPDFEAIPEFIQVHRDITKLFAAMQKKLEIDIEPSDMPSIMPAEKNKKTSSYRPSNNTIYIHKDTYGSGICYSEECGHCLREIISRNLQIENILEEDEEAVQEFFGRLAENLGRSLSPEIGLEHLFQEKERNCSESEKLKKIIQHLTKEKKLIKQIETDDEKSRSLFKDKLAPILNTSNDAISLIKKLNKKQISKADFDSSLLSLINQGLENYDATGINSGESVGSRVFDMENMNTVTTKIEKLIILLKSLLGTPKNNEEIYYAISEVRSAINDLKKKVGFPHKLITETQARIRNKENHLMGYSAAEYFIAQNPNWEDKLPELFKKESLDIYMLFKSKHFLEWLLQHGYFDLLSA